MNIILYVLDSLRSDNLSCYGYHRGTSPNIDRLCNEGVLFENAFAQSTWTRPSAASILTGVYPSVHKTITRRDKLPLEIPVIPELLKERGFETVALSAMGNVSSTLGFNRGFDQFFDLYKEKLLFSERTTSTIEKEKLYFESENEVVLPLAEDINRFFFSYLERDRKSPFFALLWLIDTHTPFFLHNELSQSCFESEFSQEARVYEERSNLLKRFWKRIKEEPILPMSQIRKKIDLYDNEIYYADHCLGTLLQKLKELNIYDETMIIVTGDHGEGFGELGRWSGHGSLPYDEIIKVPLIIKFPNYAEFKDYMGITRKSIVQLIDIAPTLLSLIKGKQLCKFQGQDLMPIIEKDDHPVHYTFSETQVTENTSIYLSIRGEGYKYIWIVPPKWSLYNVLEDPIHFFGYHFIRRFQNKNRRLYDLKKDLCEKINIARMKRKIVNKLEDKLANWQKSNEEIAGEIKSEKAMNIDEKVKEHLKVLGYID